VSRGESLLPFSVTSYRGGGGRRVGVSLGAFSDETPNQSKELVQTRKLLSPFGFPPPLDHQPSLYLQL